MIGNGAITVGSIIRGHCNGFFGSNSFDEKKVVACGEYHGLGWIVAAENTPGLPLVFASEIPREVYSRWDIIEPHGLIDFRSL